MRRHVYERTLEPIEQRRVERRRGKDYFAPVFLSTTTTRHQAKISSDQSPDILNQVTFFATQPKIRKSFCKVKFSIEQNENYFQFIDYVFAG